MKFTILLTLLFASQLYADFDETKIQSPLVDSNEDDLVSTVCRTRDHLRWDVCYSRFENNVEKMKSFKFSNTGENKIVPKSGFMVGRDFEFMFEGFARSDLSLLLWDSPDEVESHGHLKLMMFFPRHIIPSVRYESDDEKDFVIVTLPTREEVIFNGKTKEIISGALKEGSLATDSDGVALNPNISYQGTGVSVEADQVANYPVGLNSQNNLAKATIRKMGHPECKVYVKELWYTDDNKGGNVFFNKKYVTDQAFDKFVRKKCKFSIY